MSIYIIYRRAAVSSRRLPLTPRSFIAALARPRYRSIHATMSALDSSPQREDDYLRPACAGAVDGHDYSLLQADVDARRAHAKIWEERGQQVQPGRRRAAAAVDTMRAAMPFTRCVRRLRPRSPCTRGISHCDFTPCSSMSAKAFQRDGRCRRLRANRKPALSTSPQRSMHSPHRPPPPRVVTAGR